MNSGPRLVRFASIIAIAGMLGFACADDRAKQSGDPCPKDNGKADPKKKLTVMERKLKYSQQLLTGLVLKDFGSIGENADELLACVKDATWRINETEKYLRHSAEFKRELETLQKAAKDKNIDSATLAYMEMTRTCVKCHELLREARDNAPPRH